MITTGGFRALTSRRASRATSSGEELDRQASVVAVIQAQSCRPSLICSQQSRWTKKSRRVRRAHSDYEAGQLGDAKLEQVDVEKKHRVAWQTRGAHQVHVNSGSHLAETRKRLLSLPPEPFCSTTTGCLQGSFIDLRGKSW